MKRTALIAFFTMVGVVSLGASNAETEITRPMLLCTGMFAASAQTSNAAAPNVSDTLKYINDAKPSLYYPYFYVTPLTLSTDRMRLVMHSQDSDGSLHGEIDILQLDPTSISVDHPDARTDVVKIACATKQKCYTQVGHTRSQDDPPSYDRYDYFFFSIAPDGDKADRLARALGHLIELLQAEYRRSHASPVDPNDPFATPKRPE
jgi:hypothetical protein